MPFRHVWIVTHAPFSRLNDLPALLQSYRAHGFMVVCLVPYWFFTSKKRCTRLAQDDTESFGVVIPTKEPSFVAGEREKRANPAKKALHPMRCFSFFLTMGLGHLLENSYMMSLCKPKPKAKRIKKRRRATDNPKVNSKRTKLSQNVVLDNAPTDNVLEDSPPIPDEFPVSSVVMFRTTLCCSGDDCRPTSAQQVPPHNKQVLARYLA